MGVDKLRGKEADFILSSPSHAIMGVSHTIGGWW